MTYYECTTDAGMECPDLGNLSDSNLRATILSREVGGQVMFSCSQGFGLIGPAHSSCLNSGEWATPLPHCKGSLQQFKISTQVQFVHDYAVY